MRLHMDQSDKQLLLDWWLLLSTWWKDSPIRSTGQVVMIVWGLWIAIEQLLTVLR